MLFITINFLQINQGKHLKGSKTFQEGVTERTRWPLFADPCSSEQEVSTAAVLMNVLLIVPNIP
jgi:hypothetical protein